MDKKFDRFKDIHVESLVLQITLTQKLQESIRMIENPMGVVNKLARELFRKTW